MKSLGTESFRQGRLLAFSGAFAACVEALSGRVVEWQTRWLQVPVRESVWGFKSPLAHAISLGVSLPPAGES